MRTTKVEWLDEQRRVLHTRTFEFDYFRLANNEHLQFVYEIYALTKVVAETSTATIIHVRLQSDSATDELTYYVTARPRAKLHIAVSKHKGPSLLLPVCECLNVMAIADKLEQLGCKWAKMHFGWVVPPEKLSELDHFLIESGLSVEPVYGTW